MSLLPFISDSSALSFDQFCEAWQDETRARLSTSSDPAEVLVAVLQGLLSPFLDGLSESDFHFIDAQARDGLQAVYFVDEEDAQGNPVATAYLLRVVRGLELRSEGKIVLVETGKVLRCMDAGRQHAPETWDPVFDWLEDNTLPKRIKLVFASRQPIPSRETDVLSAAADMVAARIGIDCEALNLSLETLYRGNAGVQLSLRVS